MFLFIIACIAALVLIIAIGTAVVSEDFRFGAIITGIIALVAGGVCMFFATFYSNGVGEAKVLVNNVDRSVVGTVTEPMAGFKAPWIDYEAFDLFSQELVYAGSGKDAPSYTGGSVNGAEVTASVGGASGGSTQANIDIAITYSIDPGKVADIYKTYRSQERFTKQVIEKTVLGTIRSVPSQYTTTQFRGDKRTEAADKISAALKSKLGAQGVEIDFVNIQNISYPAEVEKALKAVEVANQKQQEAEANLRAAEVSAQQKVVEAKAEADANAVLAASLTEPILRQRMIDAISKAGSTIIVPDGFTGLGNLK